MTYDDLLAHFGTQAEIARAFNVSQPSVCEWQTNGIPPLRQVQAEGLTEGKLKAADDVFTRPSKRGKEASA